MHRSLPNRTAGRVRWSVDTRYNAAALSTVNGRPDVPGFLARSAKTPEQVVMAVEDWHAVVGATGSDGSERGDGSSLRTRL